MAVVEIPGSGVLDEIRKKLNITVDDSWVPNDDALETQRKYQVMLEDILASVPSVDYRKKVDQTAETLIPPELVDDGKPLKTFFFLFHLMFSTISILSATLFYF